MKKISSFTSIEHGSAMLFVISLLTILSISSLLFLKNSLYRYDTALQREKYEKQFRATEGLLQYGIAWFRKDKIAILSSLKNQEHGTLTVDVGEWPPFIGLLAQRYRGVLQVSKEHNKIVLRALLQQNGKNILIISCTLCTMMSDITVCNWNVERTTH